MGESRGAVAPSWVHQYVTLSVGMNVSDPIIDLQRVHGVYLSLVKLKTEMKKINI